MKLTITFFGLCAFVAKGNRICVLLPNCESPTDHDETSGLHQDHEHHARLTIAVKNVVAEASVVPDLETFFGQPLANWNIEDLDLEVVPPAKVTIGAGDQPWPSNGDVEVLRFRDIDGLAEAFDFFGDSMPVRRCGRVLLVGGSLSFPKDASSRLQVQVAGSISQTRAKTYASGLTWTSDEYDEEHELMSIVVRRHQELCADQHIVIAPKDLEPIGVSNTAVGPNGLQHFGLYYRLLAKYQRPQRWVSHSLPQFKKAPREDRNPPIWECVPPTVMEE